jgi:lysophospholipid acyltransferase (LPLAT)-like uncharacterized protein
MRWTRKLTRSPWVQRAIGVTAAEYLRLVWATTRFTIEPPDVFERFAERVPLIVAFWHGQHFLMPFANTGGHRGKVLISRHRDGEINAIAAERLGVETIRGSGSHGSDFSKKGGVAGFRALLDALNEGYSVGLTADIPKVARVAGIGIVRLAQMSGRPIAGALIHVPMDADDTTLELARRAVEESLNAITARAYEIADGSAGGGDRG